MIELPNCLQILPIFEVGGGLFSNPLLGLPFGGLVRRVSRCCLCMLGDFHSWENVCFCGWVPGWCWTGINWSRMPRNISSDPDRFSFWLQWVRSPFIGWAIFQVPSKSQLPGLCHQGCTHIYLFYHVFFSIFLQVHSQIFASCSRNLGWRRWKKSSVSGLWSIIEKLWSGCWS